MQTIVADGYAYDWTNFVAASQRLGDGTLYDAAGQYAFRWSPIAAAAFVVIAPIGLTAWRLSHIAVLLFLRDWRLIALVLLSYPFWFDVETGNVNTFIAVAAVNALRGSRVGTGIFLASFVLVPRPVVFPLVIWLVWKRPGWRWPLVAGSGWHAAVAGLTGLSSGWIFALVGASSEMQGPLNLAPSGVIGAWWVPIGLVLAAWFTIRGRLGLASVAASPYWLPYYLLMLILEFVRPPELDQRRTQMAAVESS